MQQQCEHHEVDDQARGSDDQELGQMRPIAVAKSIEPAEMAKIPELLAQRELAAPQLPVIEMDGHLGNVAAAALHDDFQKDLVADGIELAPGIEGGAPHCEKPAHRIVDGGEGQGEQRRHATVQPAKRAPVIRRRSALGKAGADGHLRAVQHRRQQFGSLLRRMTEVGIHDHDEVPFAALQAVQDGPAQAAVLLADHEGHPVQGQRLDQRLDAVPAVIVHQQQFEIETGGIADGLQSRDQVGNVFHLTKGRDDDAYGPAVDRCRHDG